MHELSIATGIAEFYRGGTAMREIKDALSGLADVGFRCFDLSLCYPNRKEHFLCGDDWEAKLEALAEFAAERGFTFGQCHLPFPKLSSMQLDPDYKDPSFTDWVKELTRRGIIAASRLRIPYAIVHPLTWTDSLYRTEVNLARNHEFFDPFVEQGLAAGVALTFETMRPDTIHWRVPHRYCQSHEELIGLVDSFGDPRIGICWDTGHVNHAMENQPAALRDAGARVHALHLNDNHYNNRDEHYLPFMGKVDWDGVIDALADIDYRGTLNYEVGPSVKTAPPDLQPVFWQTAYRNAAGFRNLLEDARAAKDAGKE